MNMVTRFSRFINCQLLALSILCFSANGEALLKKGDHVVSIGNTLAERMQHSGWMETLIQKGLPKHQLVFRNQAFPGDQVASRPRNKGFTTVENYLKISKADVIFVFFGYNESFAGDKGVSDFSKKMGEMIDNYRRLKPNGESAPRFVLFSPIAHENLEDPNLPSGKANNKNLAVYNAVIAEVAKDKEVGYVDLFTPSQALYAAKKEPLTINGIHLNDLGNKLIAEVIASKVLGKDVKADPKLETLRKAVLDKNYHWYNRFRAVDGNDIWGGRSGLKFVDGQSNADVLKHELTMLDVITANRDPHIHALANGRVNWFVDDSNVPHPVKVVSNIGGKSKSSSAQKEGNPEYLSPKESLKKLKHAPNYKLNIFADESMFPELANPVQMQVDGKGRLWAAAWGTYPMPEPLKEPNDRLLIFPDEDGDGVADKCITFAQVNNPLGFEFWNGGVIVASQPDLIFLRDTDGDDVADERYVLLSGIGSADTHHAANNLIYGPCGGIYWQSGIFLHNNMEHPWGPSVSTGASAMYRFDPRRFTIAPHAGNRPNPHGTAFDKWGYHYANDGTGGRSFQVRPDGKGFKMHVLLNKQVRPVAADEIISSDNFPDEMQQTFVLCNTIGYLGLKHYDLHRDGYEKKKVGEVWGTPSKTNDFLYSEDRNFRPTDAIVGEDGALYVSDWHNVIIGHMQHNIRDPERDKKHGRIYRMVYTKKPLQKPVKIAGASISQLLKNFEHPVNGVRHRTRVELSGHPADQVIAQTQKWLKGYDPNNPAHALPILEGLWVHQQFNVRNRELLEQVLASPVEHARIAAATVKHHWDVADPAMGSPEFVEEKDKDFGKGGLVSDKPELITFRVNTVVEQMRYDVKEIKVKAGRRVRIEFNNPDALPHNLLIVKPGTADTVASAAIAMGGEGFKAHYVPKSADILHSTKLLERNESVNIDFIAPAKAGDYPFVCTFPGHATLMRGIIKVTP